jgi:hypothetical protein
MPVSPVARRAGAAERVEQVEGLVLLQRQACADEGTLSFVATIFYFIGILHTNENEGGIMTEGPRLSQAAVARRQRGRLEALGEQGLLEPLGPALAGLDRRWSTS